MAANTRAFKPVCALGQGRTIGGKVSECLPGQHSTTVSISIQGDLEELRREAESAKGSGDLQAYWTARRRFLLAQAALIMGESS